jgi:heme/copper-type cytochrome/quinol oxidase subunit 4
MLELLGDMLVEMRAQSQATSAAVVEARQNATMTRVVLVLSVLAFVTSTAFAVLAATSSWPAVALAGVLGICVCWILVRLYGRDVGRG